ncbi:MAG: hypothetical protein G01um101418_507 [Parcubacteria group bacterium Gr01-1014_18]|nr:MAG: hypothetical protein Greene041636_553 [Parcubacteria group bacterium Greene0416_36]TSC80970.1 MAG: hypothetical protein G01um101418_507 [Parcubacteria group bacterium Gr01-1014_18]TSC98857.1 MAG: hypothetical protein Greene101420_490 [Parcubacteria group bacterium Greene1014_20]TSD06557.1 MAG: hypothetical protein Greene07142_832 [Parcubacteria group bacterium Greene0714_2]
MTTIEKVVIFTILLIVAGLGIWAWTIFESRERDRDKIAGLNALHASLLTYLNNEKKMPRNIQLGEFSCSDKSGFLGELVSGGLAKKEDVSRNPYCYFDFGPGSEHGAVLGIKLESTEFPSSCRLGPPAKWCDSSYYCICQPYEVEAVPVK